MGKLYSRALKRTRAPDGLRDDIANLIFKALVFLRDSVVRS